MRDGKGCFKEIECSQCAHFPFICNGTKRPSKIAKSKITQLKREAQEKARRVKWYEC